MDWTVESKPDRYSFNFKDNSEILLISEMKINGEVTTSPEISFSKEIKNQRINIEVDGIKKFFHVVKSGDIYLDKYSGWYSVSDEAYYDEVELKEVNGKKFSIQFPAQSQFSPMQLPRAIMGIFIFSLKNADFFYLLAPQDQQI